MHRRHVLALGALSLSTASMSTIARADQLTREKFHAALARDPTLAVYADTVGDQAGVATIKGRLPADLQGTFFRNGPGRFELGGERYHHWFDGDGYAQRWQIGAGTVSHLGRFVQTQRYTEESAAGQFLYPSFGTALQRRGVKTSDAMNAANTNLLPFNGSLYALWEGGSATELDPATLATIGIKTWRDDVKAMPFSAHPKRDPDGGLWNFGALPGGDQLAIYRLGPDGVLRASAMVRVPQLAMVHDFAVSAAHLIFLIPPYDMDPNPDPAPALSFADRHRWNPQRPLRAVVVSKATLQVRQIFELPAHMVFHFGNAYDDGASTRFDVVLHQGDVLAELGRLMQGERPRQFEARSATVQVRLDYATGQAQLATLAGGGEFPRVMPQVVSARHRKLALVSAHPGSGNSRYDTVNLIDTDTGKADRYRFGAFWQVEEHVLVARRAGGPETDGYLVGVAQDLRRGVTVLSVFDAAQVSAGPVALARLPYRAPHCFHGNFLPA